MLYRDYRRIPGYEYYVISNYGEVFSLKRYGKSKTIQLKPCPNSAGYLSVVLNKDGKKKSFHVHALVGNAFIGERTGQLTFDHIDRNKTNNRVDNIRLATRSEQIQNQGLRKDNKLGEKNIHIVKRNGLSYYRIKFKRTINGKRKAIFDKLFSTRKYKLNDVIKVRDEILKNN